MKTQTQHTLGPWDREIDTVYIGSKSYNFAEYHGDSVGIANASLISAAPDLLDALRFLLSDYIAIQGDKITKSSVPIEMAKAAILKAEGKQ